MVEEPEQFEVASDDKEGHSKRKFQKVVIWAILGQLNGQYNGN